MGEISCRLHIPDKGLICPQYIKNSYNSEKERTKGQINSKMDKGLK